MTQSAELYYEELLKILLWERPQAGLKLLSQGTLTLTTDPQMLTSLMFWEVTPGFSSALGISYANLRTGILLELVL